MTNESSVRLKFTAREPLQYGANAAAEFDDPDWPRFVRITDIDRNGQLRSETFRSLPPDVAQPYLLEDGDILLARSGATVGKSFYYRKEWGEACYAGYLIRLRVGQSYYPRYVYWCLQGKQYWSYIESNLIQATIQNVSAERFSNFLLPNIKIAMQRIIADFLDRETARINQLIEKKQRLIELLEVKYETLRDTVVCKGLSTKAAYKESGVDWFGLVPDHWTVCRFNRLISSKVDYRGRTPEKVDDGIFLVTARNIRPGKIDYERSQEFTTEEDWEKLSARGKPEIGDVLFTTEAPLGNIAQVDRTDVALAQRIMKFRANPALVSNDFLAEFMMSASFQRSLNLYASGSTASGIKSERMAHLFGLVPPRSEQAEIVRVVRAEGKRLEAVVEPIQRSIDRSREFRSALITAAVTGQIDVTSWGREGQTDRRLEQIAEAMTA